MAAPAVTSAILARMASSASNWPWFTSQNQRDFMGQSGTVAITTLATLSSNATMRGSALTAGMSSALNVMT